tara:strand:+ start:465 stop:848 length:384 start_codon:yes stop_codon:yes gene_type:complete
MSDLSVPLPSSTYKTDYYVIHKDELMEKFFEITKTDPRMNDKQKKAFYRAYWDLIDQEPTIEEMDQAYMSYVAHFDHIPSPFAFAKHFNRFRSGIMPNKKGESLKKIQQQQSDLKMERWIRELEEKE